MPGLAAPEWQLPGPCLHTGRRERWRGGQGTWPAWDRGPIGLLLLHNKEVGTLDAQEPLVSLGKPQPTALRLHSAEAAPAGGSLLYAPSWLWEAPYPWRRYQWIDPGAATNEGGQLTFMQGQEQGQSDGAPGGRCGNHSSGRVLGWTSEQGAPVACVPVLSRAGSSLPRCPDRLL